MDMIDITMTAVIRPKLLAETLDKIVKHVCHGDTSRFTLILNVDPIGASIKPMKVIKVAKQRFDNVVYNIAKHPSFPKAVKWVWSQVTAPYVFHWEDDVNILYDIDVDKMITILKKYKELSSLRLYRAPTPKGKRLHTFACKWIYKPEGFYMATDWRKQFGLNPILIKSEFVHEAVTRMVDHINPEKQFRVSQKYMVPLIKKWKYGLYTKPGSPRMIDGRKGQKWKNAMKLDKPVGKTFVAWEKK